MPGFVNPVYKSPAWKIVRRAVLVRDEYVCRLGLPGCKGRARSVDHIVELEDGGEPYALSNLQAACVSCNTAKGNKARHARKHGGPGRVRDW